MPDSEKFSAARVLLIDDDAISREVLAMMLGMAGYAVQCAEDGAEALSMVSEAAASSEDVILMDTQMPGLSGVELIEALRSRTSASIIAISGSDPGEAVRQAADGFLLKPLEVEALTQWVRSATPAAAAADDTGVDAQMPLTQSDETADNPTVGQGNLIDPGVLGKLRGMMPASAVTEIYAAVTTDMAARLTALKAAMDAEDVAEVRRIAHAIKGGCAMVGLSAARAAADRLESSNQQSAWHGNLLQLLATQSALEGMLVNGLPA